MEDKWSPNKIVIYQVNSFVNLLISLNIIYNQDIALYVSLYKTNDIFNRVFAVIISDESSPGSFLKTREETDTTSDVSASPRATQVHPSSELLRIYLPPFYVFLNKNLEISTAIVCLHETREKAN